MGRAPKIEVVKMVEIDTAVNSAEGKARPNGGRVHQQPRRGGTGNTVTRQRGRG